HVQFARNFGFLFSMRELGPQLMMERTRVRRKCVVKIPQMKSRMGFHADPLCGMVLHVGTMRSDPVTIRSYGLRVAMVAGPLRVVRALPPGPRWGGGPPWLTAQPSVGAGSVPSCAAFVWHMGSSWTRSPGGSASWRRRCPA